MLTVDPMSAWTFTCPDSTCQSVCQVGSSLTPNRVASCWMVASSDAWYCGAEAITWSRCPRMTSTIAAIADRLNRMASAKRRRGASSCPSHGTPATSRVKPRIT